MNVVGKVGSLITQGVYSVATPFHPFGGAIDIIVVQQPDGSFRSTPWYVRFGKFQGVLKGAEKIVRIEVNGLEADFHMYLDNSGEAYFIREIDSGKGDEIDGVQLDSVGGEDRNKGISGVCRLEHSISDSGVAQLRDECESSGTNCLERSESDTGFYDFQDDQTSLEGSLSLSEFGSNRYDNDRFGEAQGSDSEVVLVSVDGHVLTAPVLASEHNAEIVQLKTPQFHLGPGEEADFCEGNEEFGSGDGVWAADYMSQLNTSMTKDESGDVCCNNNDPSALTHELNGIEEETEHACHTEESPSINNGLTNLHDHAALEDGTACNKDDNALNSSLEPLESAEHVENADFEEGGTLDGHSLEENPPHSQPDADESQDGAISESRRNEGFSPPSTSGSPYNNRSLDLQVSLGPIETKVEDTKYVSSNSMFDLSDVNKPDCKDEQLNLSPGMEGMDVQTEEQPAPEEDSSRSEILETKTPSSKEVQTNPSMRFEISLCGNELRAGMGSKAAAEVFNAHLISLEEYKSSAASIIKNKDLVFRFGKRYLTWDKAAPIVLGMAAFGLDLPAEPQDAIPIEQDETPNTREDESVGTPTSASRRWRLWPIPFRRVKTLDHSPSNSSSEEIFVDSEPTLQNSLLESPPPVSSGRTEMTPRKQFIRTNIPTSEQISSLNLKDGQNMITFCFSTRVLGTQQVDAHIYLWKWNDRIVISDVDGTITRSDVLGQFMPLVGRDWSQSGVAALFSAIKENGYQLLFLSARAIVQAYLTRSFLFNLKQDGKTLPNGPVVISPDGLFPSLYREVIRRAPHEFKIACLEDIKKLFPSDYNPFYAGFGNRDTDELSYRKIGIPKGKIFIINPKGEVAINQHRIDVKSYTSLHTLVNDMFPPTSLVEQEDYNSWNFWRMPLPEVE